MRQRQSLTGEALATQLAYWQRQLAGSPPLDLPTEHPRPPTQSFRGATHYLHLPQALTASLQRLSQAEGLTLFMLLLAAFEVLLYRYSSQEDFCIGTAIANRTRIELERLIGFFVNTLVLRSDVQGNPTFRTLLGRVREMALAAYAHQDLPFETLVEALQPARDLSRSPLFQVMFTLQNVANIKLELAGLHVESFQAAITTAKFDLTWMLWEAADGLSGKVVYSTDLFEEATIARMIGHYQALLERIAIDTQQRIAYMPLLTEGEQQQMLVQWNATVASEQLNQCVHDLFAVWAGSTPECVAVVCDAEHLTYAELDTRANQLAHYLRRLGVGPETRVGICIQRSLDLLVGLLGILKAGAPMCRWIRPTPLSNSPSCSMIASRACS